MMTMGHFQIFQKLWVEHSLKQLSFQDKTIMIYMITNPHIHCSGVYYLPIEIVSKETGASKDLIIESIISLSKTTSLDYDCNDNDDDEDAFLFYDNKHEIIYIKNMLYFHQIDISVDDIARQNIIKHLSNLPQSYVIRLFYKHNPSLLLASTSPTRKTSSTPTKPKTSINNRVQLTDADFLEMLQTSEAYAGIDVKREFEKANAWCLANNRINTRRFFVNWLNKLKPMQASHSFEQTQIDRMEKLYKKATEQKTTRLF